MPIKRISIIIFGLSLFALGIIIGSLISFFFQTNKVLKKDQGWLFSSLNQILNQKKSEEFFTPRGLPILEEKDFFKEVEDLLISKKEDFIKADLSAMKLAYYQKGKLFKEYPILSKGKEGTWWETPAGIYKIELKREKHLSSICKVWMPYAMVFQGNFFIHGETYYPGGKPTTLAFTGGCLRLKTEDAKELYQLVKIGTPVLVFDQKFKRDNFLYHLKPPAITAKNYLAIDLKNNFVFLEKNSEEKVPIASITKLMTALVATEYLYLGKEIKITDEMLVKTSIPRLKAGQKYNVFELLSLLLLESSNEAARALSNFFGPQKFVELMNLKARSIGMENSHFVDPAGSSSENISTLKDLAILARYLYYNRKFILDISQGKKYDIFNFRFSNILRNFNKLDEKEFIGGKVGLASASGETILAIFEIDIENQKRPIAILALGSSDAKKDVKEILNWIKNIYPVR